MLDLVEKIFARHGIRSLRYDGSMDRHARENALSTFKKAGGPKVILIRSVMVAVIFPRLLIGLPFISTRCGGVGLKSVFRPLFLPCFADNLITPAWFLLIASSSMVTFIYLAV